MTHDQMLCGNNQFSTFYCISRYNDLKPQAGLLKSKYIITCMMIV